MVGCAKLGLNFTACCPEKYFPAPELIAQCQAVAAETGATLTFAADEGTVVEPEFKALPHDESGCLVELIEEIPAT